MSDRNPANQLSLGDALRALPLAAPDRDVWSALAAQLAPRQAPPARRRFVVPLAIAAGILALATVLIVARHALVPAVDVATIPRAPASTVANDTNVANATNVQNAATEGEAQLVALESRSRALERWLSDTRGAAAPLPAQDLAAAAEIEDLIGLVDVELAAAPRNRSLALWHHRVALLEDLTTLRYSNYRIAESMVAATDRGAPNRIN
jgi:hypothetical protein